MNANGAGRHAGRQRIALACMVAATAVCVCSRVRARACACMRDVFAIYDNI